MCRHIKYKCLPPFFRLNSIRRSRTWFGAHSIKRTRRRCFSSSFPHLDRLSNHQLPQVVLGLHCPRLVLDASAGVSDARGANGGERDPPLLTHGSSGHSYTQLIYSDKQKTEKKRKQEKKGGRENAKQKHHIFPRSVNTEQQTQIYVAPPHYNSRGPLIKNLII